MLKSAVVIWCLGVAGLAAHVTLVELRAQQSASSAYLAGAPVGLIEPAPLPYAQKSLGKLLIACSDALGSSAARLMPADLRRTSVRHCSTLASRAKLAWPGYAPVDLVRATLALERHDARGFLQALDLAMANAPNQGWQAARRLVLLTEVMEAHGDTGLERLVLHDTGVLLGTQSGAELLARQKARGGPLTRFIDLAVQVASANEQRRFQNLLRKVSQS